MRLDKLIGSGSAKETSLYDPDMEAPAGMYVPSKVVGNSCRFPSSMHKEKVI